ncbi:MAG: 5'-methylthioadenosine/S-adenosylhomocysteine nucleosidase [Flavobacterium sp.]|nr:5'-methylthioadenosine/S-adenosylhomocysteine nucleosidase [Flavobacterium sp.]
MNTIVIQTALAIEEQAVISKLSNVTDYIHPESKSIYKVGDYISNGNKLQIIVGRTNQTNINAAIETERIINHFHPSYIFFVGVAGGLKDVRIGDIVIGSDVYGYERGKEKDVFLPRPQFGFSSYELEQLATSFSISDKWSNISRSLVNTKFQSDISAFVGTIASGEKVVGSVKSSLFNFLKQNCSHALAVEMEGLGFLEACRPYPLIKSLLIRGISDLVDDKENSDKEGSQPYASKNATEFLFGLIDYIRIEQYPIKLSLKQKLFEISVKLYPEGIKDKGIWMRAGGDLSIIHLNSTGKAQWIEALTIIENGGGGDIDFDSLVTEMKKDYPKNVSLNEI